MSEKKSKSINLNRKMYEIFKLILYQNVIIWLIDWQLGKLKREKVNKLSNIRKNRFVCWKTTTDEQTDRQEKNDRDKYTHGWIFDRHITYLRLFFNTRFLITVQDFRFVQVSHLVNLVLLNTGLYRLATWSTWFS